MTNIENDSTPTLPVISLMINSWKNACAPRFNHELTMVRKYGVLILDLEIKLPMILRNY